MNGFSSISFLIRIFFIFTLIASSYSSESNPYKILGVKRFASSHEIRRSFKELAKEWHPDKSNRPDAEKKFVEMKQAYELLSNSERRRIYDTHGIVDEDSHFYRRPHDYSHYNRFVPNPLEEFLGNKFSFEEGISLYNKMSITANYFERIVLMKSEKIPYILSFYNDWCFRCIRLVGAFKKMIDTLEPIGIMFATVNAAHEQTLLQKLGVDEVPRLVLILNGQCHVFKDNSYSVQKVIDFLRRRFSPKLVQNLQDNSVENFLSGWMDNRVRAIFLQPQQQLRLRYLIIVFSFRDRIKFGFVNIRSEHTINIQEKFQIQINTDTLLVFNEIFSNPILNICISNISTFDLRSIIYANQYLALPRLSSQEMLEGICPVEWNRPRKRICIILITENTASHDQARDTLREIAVRSGYNPERVRFAYIFQEKQNDFIKAISNEILENTLLQLVVIWRRDTSHVKYEWITGINLNIERVENEVNNTKVKLDKTIKRLLRTSETLSHEANVKCLHDEHAQELFEMITKQFWQIKELISENIKQEHVLAAFSLLGTIIFMIIVGYALIYLVRIEEENLPSKLNFQTEDQKFGVGVTELKLHELRAEKYNGMVRLLKPGCRTIILITDLKTRSRLIPTFHKAVWPYRKTKTLMFGHMLIEKGLIWYSELLRLSLSKSRDLRINPRNCIGTVIAINGHRKYYCMYHARHRETNTFVEQNASQLIKTCDNSETGNFLCIEDSRDANTEKSVPKVILQENLLDGLNNWLSRLFEGSTHQYYVNYWPDFPTK